ncbi:MAG: PP0621 family protein [Pseudomonadota bacterium]
MKYLLVFFVVFFAIWLWRKNRRDEMRERAVPPRKAAPPAVGAPQAMLRCAQCGLHLPASDAVQGAHGMYCSAAHRQTAER